MIRSNVVTKHTIVLVNKKKYMESKYWANKGKYSKEIDELYRQGIIPMTGKTNDPALEVIRLVNHIGYEIYNNGGCNLLGSDGIRYDYYEELEELRDNAERINLDLLVARFIQIIEDNIVLVPGGGPDDDEEEYGTDECFLSDSIYDKIGGEMDELLDKAYEYYTKNH